ncbi:MAG: PIN domain-containing protein, partial [Dehalococcoidia bacterium]
MIERLTVVVRVLGAIFFGFLGLRTGQALAEGDTGLVRILFWVLTPAGFTLFGTLAAPFIITVPLQRLQEWSKTIPPLQLILGTFGLLAGFLLGALATPFLLTLPGIGGWVAPFVVSFLLGLIGVVVMVGREEEVADFLSRYLPSLPGAGNGSTREIVVDTSAIIDGRIADVAMTGFLQGALVVPRFILDELRHIADSPETLRRNRGRRGLDMLSRLQKEAPIPVRVAEDDFPDARDADAKLIRLASKLKATILTNDFNLARIA